MIPTAIHRRLKIYGGDAVASYTVNRWEIKFRDYDPGKAIMFYETLSGRPTTTTEDKNRKHADDVIQNDRRITQNVSQRRV